MNKKHIYIRIKDKSDIDLTRISVYDLNNRYIDPQGNMYGLKYNRMDRKIDLIKIVRAQDKDAVNMQYRLARDKAAGRTEATESVIEPGQGEGARDDHEEAEVKETRIDSQAIVDKAMQLCLTHRDRLRGVIMNIRNSNVIPKEHKHDDIVLEDIIRSMEIDMFLGIEKIENHRRELIQYPRSLTYYQSRADTRSRKIIDSLSTDTQRAMKFIFFTEMLGVLKPYYKTANELMGKLKLVLSTVHVDEQRHSHLEKQSYADAMTSISSTLSEVDAQLHDLEELELFVSDADNF